MVRRLIACVFVLGLGTGLALAQGTAQLTGVVKDGGGGVLPGVAVTVTQTSTGLTRNAVSGADGLYVLPGLPIGPYRLEAVLQGFRTYTQTGIQLQVGSNVTANVTMELGNVQESVTVTANAVSVETRNTAGVSQTMDSQRVVDLPLNGRNSADLIQNLPAVVPNGSASSRSMQGGVVYAVGGGLPFGVSYVLDGATHNNPFDNLNLPLPFPDALQEFKAETNALTAQNGMHSGAAVVAITKSGGNQFHGNAFDFLRDHNLNATNPFNAVDASTGARRDDGLRRNQFGGTLGGPIVHDRAFFFAGYQGTRTNQTLAQTRAFVPTAAMLAGDFTAIASPACNAGRQITLLAPFVGNRISPSLFSRAALNIASKLPTTTDPCGQAFYSTPNDSHDAQFVGKLDLQVTPKHRVIGRYLTYKVSVPTPIDQGGTILTSTLGGRDNLAQMVTLGDDHVISSSTLNAVRFAFNRTAIHRTGPQFFSPSDVGVNMYSYVPGFTQLTVTPSAFTLGGVTEVDSVYDTNTYQLSDDVTLVRGAHQFALGGSWAQWSNYTLTNTRSNGNLTIGNTATGLALGDFMLGRLQSLIQTAPGVLDMRERYLGLYAQDTWRVGARLTLNGGVRWEPYFPQQLLNGAIYQFDLNRYIANQKSTVFSNAPAGLTYPGDAGFPSQAGMPTLWGNVAPRVGIAWDVKGDGKTAIRAAYGKGYDYVNSQFHIGTSFAPPWGSQINVNNPPGGLDNPFGGTGTTNPFPTTFSPNATFSLFGPYLSLNNALEATHVHQWNVGMEREVAKGWVASAGYVGSRTMNIWETDPVNNALATVTSAALPTGQVVSCTPGAANFQTCMNQITNQRRILAQLNPAQGQYFANVDMYVSDGQQSYNGMVLSLRGRTVGNTTININYVLSRCYGSPDNQGGNTVNVGTGYNQHDNHAYDDGYCDADRRQNFSVTAGASMRRFEQPVARAILSDWRLVGSLRMLTGPWLTITTGSDRALNGNVFGAGTQRASQVDGVSPYGDDSIDPLTGGRRFLTSAAFTQPAFGTYGTISRNGIRGIATKSLDLALSRPFRLSNSQSIEVRIEAFNAFNWFQWNQPSANLSSSQFGLITSAGDPRIVQLALKYAF